MSKCNQNCATICTVDHDGTNPTYSTNSWFNFGGLNPKADEFFKFNPKVTLLGLYWATYWRTALFAFFIYLGIWLLAGVFTFLANIFN